MKKRIFPLILSLVLIATCMPSFSGEAFAASPAIKISSAAAKPGDSVNLTVSISENPGITSIDFSVQYDSAQFTLTGKQNGTLLGGTINSQTLDKVPYYCGWINSLQKKNYTDNGVLITLTFKVKDGAVNGKQAISFTRSSVTGYNADIKAITFAAENGYIEVSGGKDASKTDSKTDTGTGGSSSQTGGSTGTVTPAIPTTPTNPSDATDTAEEPKSDGDSETAKDSEGTQPLTASQQKIIAKVKAMDIKYTSAKYNKSKKTYTIKFKKTNKSYRLDGYQIYRSTKKSSGYTKVAKTTKLTWTDKNLGKKGKTYYYKVRGYRKVAGKTYYTNWSSKKKLTVK